MVKKQSWIKENWGYPVILIIVLSLVFWHFYPKSTFYICSKSPEKCVFDDSRNGKIVSYQTDISLDQHYVKLRLKTQSEFDINDCNSNPRDDVECKCEEIRYYDKIANNSFEKFNCNEVDLTKQELCNHYNIILDEFFKHCLKSRPKTDWEKHPEDYVAETKQYCRIFGIVYGEEFQKDYELLDNKCIIPLYSIYQPSIEPYDGDWQNGTIINQTTYRLKNECEKGNKNWVEETKINEIDTSIVPHLECILQTGWFCPGIGIINLPCDNSTGKCILESGLFYIGCEYKSDICIFNQTICREKRKLII